MYALIENGAVVQYPYSYVNLKQDNPNTSFPANVSNATLESFGVYVVYNTTPPVVTKDQYLQEGTPVYNDEDQRWEQVWIVVDMTPEQIAERDESDRQANKTQAESLLSATDWTCTVDINNPEYSDPYLANQDEFLAYRSAVRKIAVNPPVTVTEWPVEPEEVWASV
jgi:hypothetical protein